MHQVAPFAGAWIETESGIIGNRSAKSPPSRGRGLKLVFADNYAADRQSPPSRGRGLKPTAGS